MRVKYTQPHKHTHISIAKHFLTAPFDNALRIFNAPRRLPPLPLPLPPPEPRSCHPVNIPGRFFKKAVKMKTSSPHNLTQIYGSASIALSAQDASSKQCLHLLSSLRLLLPVCNSFFLKKRKRQQRKRLCQALPHSLSSSLHDPLLS